MQEGKKAYLALFDRSGPLCCEPTANPVLKLSLDATNTQFLNESLMWHSVKSFIVKVNHINICRQIKPHQHLHVPFTFVTPQIRYLLYREDHKVVPLGANKKTFFVIARFSKF
jgi:hypothetical protein